MKRQSGNALVFILITVFLLGGLTVLMMRTGGQSDETGDIEKITIDVTKLVRYVGSIQNAVEQMRMRGVSENEISFANTLYQLCNSAPIQGAGHNPRCTRPECELFNAKGGAIVPMEVPVSLRGTGSCASWKKGAMALNLKRVERIGKQDHDELMLEVHGLNKQACLRINQMLGIPAVSGDAPVDDIAGGSTFSGTFTTFGPQIGNEYAGFAGRRTFCLKDASGSYSYMTVIVPR